MAHEDLTLELATGLNVITGPNNVGKTSILIALQTLFYNERGDFMVSHGQGEASVTIETVKGDLISWKRHKNTVHYEINGKTYSRLKGEVPEVLHELLKMPLIQAEEDTVFNVHFSDQKAPLFLIDGSPRHAALFFASASDAQKLLEMQKKHRLKTSERKQKKAWLEEELEKVHSNLENFEGLSSLKEKWQQLQKQKKSLMEHHALLEQLHNYIVSLKELQKRRGILNQKYHLLRSLYPVPDFKETTPIKRFIERAQKLQFHYQKNAKSLQVFARLRHEPAFHSLLDLKKYMVHLKRLLQSRHRLQSQACILIHLQNFPPFKSHESLFSCIKKLRQSQKKIAYLNEQYQEIILSLDVLDYEWKAFKETHPYCPLCGSQIHQEKLCN